MIEQISPNIYRLEFPSYTLSPFTHTNSYLIWSDGQAALVDPGFYKQESLKQLLNTLETTHSHLTAILLTHTHPDHQEGIRLIEKLYPEIPVYVHKLELDRVNAGRVMVLDKHMLVGKLRLEVIFTPGHSPGHVSFYGQDIAIVGDVVAGYGSTWIGVPDGNYTDYFATLEKLKSLDCKILAPAHGPIIYDPARKLAEVTQHRLHRLEQVYKALEHPLSLAQLGKHVYPDVDAALQPAIEGSLLALLEKLLVDNQVEKIGTAYRQKRSAF